MGIAAPGHLILTIGCQPQADLHLLLPFSGQPTLGALHSSHSRPTTASTTSSHPRPRRPDPGAGPGNRNRPSRGPRGVEQGKPIPSMTLDVLSCDSRTRTSVGQSLALAVPLANAPPPSRGPPSRIHGTARRLAPRAPRTQDHKTKPGDWTPTPPGLYMGPRQNQYFRSQYNGSLTPQERLEMSRKLVRGK